MYLLCIGAATG